MPVFELKDDGLRGRRVTLALLIAAMVFLSGCLATSPTEDRAAATATATPTSVERESFPNETVPDDGNEYIVLISSENPHLRPTLSSPALPRIRASRHEPKAIQVFGVSDAGNWQWWQVEIDGKPAYLPTRRDGFASPHVATDLPPEIDEFSNHRDDELVVTGIVPKGPDTAGGVGIRVGFRSPATGPELKYIRFAVSPYNAVGDQVRDELSRRDYALLRLTGPVHPDARERWQTWDRALYNNSIVCFELDEVQVTLMDDSTKTYTGDDLRSLLHSGFENDCSYRG
ncbi:hypothetical protein J2T57_002605 [Natronocella acetinitrilica]|uniref:Uncharacterized protein n=1 Tax=Natronocella acetinitrilica TaxID=414046 RepID=A0AAE3KBF1_9GAMM|nr:hypothetical protein [Natronocella acetinitrilica]MCP1675455.1 hypothetical protein [Natronocella acetinitrilica]